MHLTDEEAKALYRLLRWFFKAGDRPSVGEVSTLRGMLTKITLKNATEK